jgi:hypothetical protein
MTGLDPAIRTPMARVWMPGSNLGMTSEAGSTVFAIKRLVTFARTLLGPSQTIEDGGQRLSDRSAMLSTTSPAGKAWRLINGT